MDVYSSLECNLVYVSVFIRAALSMNTVHNIVSSELSSERGYVITNSVYIVFVYTLYVVFFCKIDHCAHVHWCISIGLWHNDPWVESHIWTQQKRG